MSKRDKPGQGNSNEKRIRLVTAESVRAGHPDKLCDRIADTLLDAHMEQDPEARVAIEVMATAGKIMVAGEVQSKANINYGGLILRTLKELGYRPSDLWLDEGDDLQIEIDIHGQSPEIGNAVDGENGELGAGDQGIMVGYATEETPEYLPLPVVLAHRICRRLDELRPALPCLGVDGKAQVTVAYEKGRPVGIREIVVSAQHTAGVDRHKFEKLLREEVILPVIPEEMKDDPIRIHLNPSGSFILGGPAADTGLTGRKLAVDCYGPVAHIGGGALSGKDCTKTDRSGAYAARWVAKHIVAAGLARRCEVQIAYAIGQAKPVSVTVDAFGTARIPEQALEEAVQEVFDLRPSAVIKALELRKQRYAPLTAYGHFGRLDLQTPWERTDKTDALLEAVRKAL